MIQLGEKIRELRRRDGRTQEALASALGVTAQAVSRWEKEICCPDMEMIPSIANYFGVSIDELFGYDNERSQKVGMLAAKIRDMNRQNNGKDVNMEECIFLARQALIEFPGNETLTLALASVLYNAGYVRRGEHHLTGPDGYSVYDVETHRTYPEWQEAIKLYEKLLPSLPDGKNRQQAVMELAQLYKNMGEHEKALLLAENAPEMAASKPFLRIQAFDGKAAVAASGEVLLETLQKSAELMIQIVLADGTISPQAAAASLQHAEDMFSMICAGCYGRYLGFLACIQMLRSYYLWLAEEKEGAFTALDKALTFAEKLDGLYNSPDEFFTAPLLHHVPVHAEKIPADSRFRAELPELWPWWDVPQGEKVRAEMSADPRWAEWERRARES